MILLFSRIVCASVPARTFDPTSSVSGRSVFSPRVTHGTPRMHASSCRPPESVMIKRAFDSRRRKEGWVMGFVRVIKGAVRLKWVIIFPFYHRVEDDSLAVGPCVLMSATKTLPLKKTTNWECFCVWDIEMIHKGMGRRESQQR